VRGRGFLTTDKHGWTRMGKDAGTFSDFLSVFIRVHPWLKKFLQTAGVLLIATRLFAAAPEIESVSPLALRPGVLTEITLTVGQFPRANGIAGRREIPHHGGRARRLRRGARFRHERPFQSRLRCARSPAPRGGSEDEQVARDGAGGGSEQRCGRARRGVERGLVSVPRHEGTACAD
jgi:hypothetical protein